MLGVTQRYVFYLERGERKPSKTIRLLLGMLEEKEKGKEIKGDGKSKRNL